MSDDAKTLSLSLVSHTNAGKTTLARTLLGRDVGEVRDAPHVTEFADAHTMVERAGGERLQLWDTPGFGDTARLARRLRQAEHPIGRFLGEAWDRWRDRPFWSTQQALRNLRDEADVMLYLVNASESPEAAGYVVPEMELLAWIGKPVIVLLNQLGAPRAQAVEAAEVARWRSHLGRWPAVREVLPLDAFARCWVQELTLLRAIEAALEGDRRALMARLSAAWREQHLGTFAASMAELAAGLARLASATETVPDDGLGARVRGAGAAIGLGRAAKTPAVRAQQVLAERLDAAVRADTQALIRLHGLGGEAHGEILTRLATAYELRLRMDETRAALWGGAVTGALVGLKADLLSGGLTLGGGLIAGGLLGALGSAGLARCVNLVRGTDRSWIAWSGEALDAMVEAALLRYLAVAHFGRGRGDWAGGESPPHWKEAVAAALAPDRQALAALWSGRQLARAGDGERERLARALEPPVAAACRRVLGALYPEAAAAVFAGANAPIGESTGDRREVRR